jgi:hypothetical protein
VRITPQTTFGVRMDSEVKQQFADFCSKVVMTATTAFKMFARAGPTATERTAAHPVGGAVRAAPSGRRSQPAGRAPLNPR